MAFSRILPQTNRSPGSPDPGHAIISHGPAQSDPDSAGRLPSALSDGVLSTLRGLRGNARGAILTEPLWGIPFNLFAPYASVYMLALGLTDAQIGTVISVGLAGQVVFSLLSGVLADRMGRRRATLVFDLIAWSAPCLIWAAAQDLRWFLLGALVNSARRVPDNTWNLLLVEDTDPEELVHIYAMVYTAGQLAVFFAPLAGFLISRFDLVPTVRGLYVLAFLMMTTKFLLLNTLVTETERGRIRMEETRGRSLLSLLGEVRGLVRTVLTTRQTVHTIALMALVSVVTVIQTTFWSIIAMENIGIPAEYIAYFPFLRSLAMLGFLGLLVPRLRYIPFGRPMVAALCAYALSMLVLVSAPKGGYGLLAVSVLLESGAYSVVATQTECLAVWNVDPAERARIVSLAHTVVIACTTPFGWLAGLLSEVDRALPFLLNAMLLLGGIWVVGRLKAATGTSAVPAP